MCGISGAVNISLLQIGDFVYHQRHRGPDNYDLTFLGDNIIFGHNRLSVIDLSENGNQPMIGNRYAITYNGEIYNYKELGFSGNDARVLLQYIEAFGIERALADINGMCAFAVYDKIERKIHLAVDRFGQKPLYYFHEGDKFAFASSVGALMQLKDKWKIDEEGLQSYWLLGSTMGENSIISGIKRLTGSHIFTYDVQKNVSSCSRYWQPKYQENTNGIEDLIIDSIQKVKVSDVPIYLFLSGGVDSTLVASQFTGGNAVHLGEKEWSYAKQAADKFDIKLLQVNPDQSNVMESLQDYAFKSGEPSMAALIPYITSKEVSKFAKVAISANGADELFFGYDRTSSSVTEKQLSHILRGFYKPHMIASVPPNDLCHGRWFELQTYVQYDLNKTLDNAAMCHSLEVRSPFLDHRLVEMALSIPESVHRKQGNKTILKNMLRKMGFSDQFVNRPKLGFSLHSEPEGMEDLKTEAWKFVKENGFLKCDDDKLSGRDERYLKMSALSFYAWYQTWQNKIT